MKHKFLLLVIIVSGFLLRAWRLDDVSNFEMDEEVIAWKTLKFWRDGQPFLIGGGTPFGFHLGPAFYYLSAIPLILTKGDPAGWMFLTLFVSIVTLFLMWFVGKTLYGESVGLVAAALWAFSFTTVMFDRHWWPLVLDPTFSLLTVLSLFHILKGRSRWWIVLGLTLSFAWQTDLTNLILFLAAGFIAIKTFKEQWKHIAVAVGIFALSLMPIVLFEMRHPGANLGKLNIGRPDPAVAEIPILDLVQFIPSVFSSMLIPSWRSISIADLYTWCKDVAASRLSSPPAMMIIATGFLLYPVIRWFRKKKASDLSLTVLVGSGIGGISLFRFFGGDLFDFYLAPLYPVFFIATALFLTSLSQSLSKDKRLSWVERRYPMLYRRATPSALTTILVALFALHLFSVNIARHSQSLSVKQHAIAWAVEQVGRRPFALASISDCHRYNGIRYLFMLAGNEPVVSFMDSNYAWLYDKPPATGYPDLFVAFVTPQDLTAASATRYNELVRRAIDVKQFGDFDVIIADNRDHALAIDF